MRVRECCLAAGGGCRWLSRGRVVAVGVGYGVGLVEGDGS